MANPHGTPIRYDYLAADVDAAQAFYMQLVGWRVEAGGGAGIDHRILVAPDGSDVGGLMRIPDGSDGAVMQPGWFAWFGVDDVDAAVARVEALGDYKFIHAGAICLGATMNAPAGGRKGWRFYVLVPCIDEAVERLKTAGGRLIHGPDRIPGGAFAVIAEDGSGARFGLVGPRQ